MKFITIAFLFQFLISCWPKSNIIIKIKQQYGHDTLKLVRKLEKNIFKTKEESVGLGLPKTVSS